VEENQGCSGIEKKDPGQGGAGIGEKYMRSILDVN